MPKVYLAGAMHGLPDRGQGWRETAIAKMPADWQAINPYTVELERVTPRELIRADYIAIASCDAVLVNIRPPSWGTAMELQYAHGWLGMRVIGFPFLRPILSTFYSPWLLAHISFFCPTLDVAIEELASGYQREVRRAAASASDSAS